jgi:hypothetical protein
MAIWGIWLAYSFESEPCNSYEESDHVSKHSLDLLAGVQSEEGLACWALQ